MVEGRPRKGRIKAVAAFATNTIKVNMVTNATTPNATNSLQLSIVIICWNDWKVLKDCLESIYRYSHSVTFEVIVSDNGSTDDSIEQVRRNFPQVRLLENNRNLGFAKGNNVGIQAAQGEYTLILNPDTIIHEGALDRWVVFAEKHQGAGGFGLRVLNPDGSYQISARPFPSIRGEWIAALGLRPLGLLSDAFVSDKYVGWHGDSEREIGWQSGCCVMFRTAILKSLGGFDERFFYHCEEVDLCLRVWQAGHAIRFTPSATITHLGGQSVKKFPIRFEIEKLRNRYRYFHKHFGAAGANDFRRVEIAKLRVRQVLYGLLSFVKADESLRGRLETYRTVVRWNRLLDPVRFVERGEEPEMGLSVLRQAS
jgi:GT2 family glycosyltransferase